MQGSDALNTVPTKLRGTQTRTTNEWIMTILRSCTVAVVGIQSGTSNVLRRALLNLRQAGAARGAIQLTSDAFLRIPRDVVFSPLAYGGGLPTTSKGCNPLV